MYQTALQFSVTRVKLSAIVARQGGVLLISIKVCKTDANA